ncbi:MAG: ABC transporter ATP-binding protein [bacterium]|nr:ABC transporter ATP-binding protein [bacterium]
MLELREVSKSFGGLRAVDRVSAVFQPGRITALIGPNGAGKTTLFHLIGGVLQPDEGDILYNGKRLNGLPPWKVARLGIGRLFQDVRVFRKLSALENALTAFPNQLGESPLWSILQRPKVVRQEVAATERARRLLAFVGLLEMADDPAESLSYGQQKLLAIARLLAAGSEVLLLDEPTAGVNPEMAKSILNILRQLAKEGKTNVVIEHDMGVVMEIADWVYFMDDGQIVAQGTPEEVLGDATVRAAYLGL